MADPAASLYITGSVGIGNLTPTTTLNVSGSISASGDLDVQGTVSASNFYLTSSGTVTVDMGISGDDNIAKWAFHRNGIRKHILYLEGRNDAGVPQDSLVFKHGIIDDGDDHINFHTEQDDQTVYFHGDISSSGDLYIESDNYIKFADESGAGTLCSIRENAGSLYIDSNEHLLLDSDNDIYIRIAEYS